MPIIAQETGSNYTPPPEDIYPCVCADVVDIGEVESEYAGEKRIRHMVKLVWQIDYLREDGEPYELSRRFTLSLNEKAALRSFLERWRGRRFSADELRGFDLEKLIGANGQLQVIHNPSKDGSTLWANVEMVIPPPKGAERLAPTANYVRVQDRVAHDDEQAQETEF